MARKKTNFDLQNVPRYWQGLPHQVAALNYLWENTSTNVRDEFVSIWRTSVQPTILINQQQLQRIFVHCRVPGRLEEFLGPLNEVMTRYQINTPLRIAHFLAQLGHESGSLNHLEELWVPTAAQRTYEGRRDLGNTQPGDGRKFKGHGPIQITGRANTTAFAQSIGRPEIIDNPRLLVDPALGSLAAGWFWNEGNSTGRSLNPLADRDDLRGITRIVNGGQNGLADRAEYLARAKSVLGIQSTGDPATLEIQKALNQHGFQLVEDGIPGLQTEAAIRAFQRRVGLQPDGIVGPLTRARLGLV